MPHFKPMDPAFPIQQQIAIDAGPSSSSTYSRWPPPTKRTFSPCGRTTPNS